ncbi:MAG: hypothetical protein AAF533_12430 [Acidobacteriota bacterium]
MIPSPLEPGVIVIAYLQQPREQVLGRVLAVDAWGLLLRALPVDSADDWIRQVCSDTDPTFDMSRTFYPMHRIEKIEFDEVAPGIRSYQERFAERADHSLLDELRRRFPDDVHLS